MKESYFNVLLNNNIFADMDLYGLRDGAFTNQCMKDGKLITLPEEEQFKVATNNNYVPLEKVPIICYEKGDELYDIVTNIEIPHTIKPEKCDCITYYRYTELNEVEVAKSLEKLASYKPNIDIYRKRMQSIMDISKNNYQDYINQNKRHTDELVRSRKIIEDFRLKYGNK